MTICVTSAGAAPARGGIRPHAEPGTVDLVISPELALVDPELRRRALSALSRPAPAPLLRPAPTAQAHPVEAPRPSLPVAATAYAAVVFGRMLSAGLTLTGLLLLLVVVTLLLR
jgi:hypothetical protein